MAGRPTTTRNLLRVMRADSPGDALFMVILGTIALGIIVLFAYLVFVLARAAWPAMSEFGLGFIWAESWNPDGQVFGAAPYIVGTLLSAVVGLVVAIPVAVGTAIALAILLPRYVAGPLGIIVELLAAVPSIVFGVWGFFIIAPFVRDLSDGATFGPSLLAAGLVLAVMVVPIISVVTRDMILAVPQAQRDAAMALGATPWEVTWKVVLPYARPGIMAAVILGFGRAIGETMAVIMLIGNQPLIPRSLYDPASTIASVIANEFGDPSGPLHYSSLVYLGLILLVFSLVMNLTARLVVARLGKRLGVDRL